MTLINTTIKLATASMLFIATLFAPLNAALGYVQVFGEGVYTQDELVVNLYADITDNNVLSYGVKLIFDPGELTVSSAQKDMNPTPFTDNPTKWYLGDSSAAYRNNPDPDISTPGEILFIGGKLDPSDPTSGVLAGNKIFLGQARFTPAGADMPEQPVMSITYARDAGTGPYDNFVRLNTGTPEVLDSSNVEFGSLIIAAAGDADGNGSIRPSDINGIKSQIGNPNAPCYVDCDGNGSITPSDINCIKAKLN